MVGNGDECSTDGEKWGEGERKGRVDNRKRVKKVG